VDSTIKVSSRYGGQGTLWRYVFVGRGEGGKMGVLQDQSGVLPNKTDRRGKGLKERNY